MYGVPKTYYQLEEYWKYLQINEIAGYGIKGFPTTGVLGMGCGDYWNQTDRYYMATAIAKAEHRMEADRWLGFPLRRKYERPRQMPYEMPLALGKYVRGCGVQTETWLERVSLTLSSGGNVNDPVIFTINVDFADIDELIVKSPSSYYWDDCVDFDIFPECVTIIGGVATIEIPRARLLKPEFFKDYKNDTDRPAYTDDTNFLTELDIYRNYLDTSTGTNLVWWRQIQGSYTCYQDVLLTSCGEPSGACADVRQLACPYVKNQRLGFVQLEPATYSSGYTKASYAVRRQPDGVEINYMRGYYDRYDEMDEDIQRAVIAWAHTNLPDKYVCQCEAGNKYWRMDNAPIEPAIRIGSGRSTWGNLYAEQIIREFDAKQGGYKGGLL